MGLLQDVRAAAGYLGNCRQMLASEHYTSVKDSQLGLLLRALARAKLTTEQADELMREIRAQEIWSMEDVAKLGAQVLGLSHLEEALQRDGCERLQDYTNCLHYLDENLWNQLQSPHLSFEEKAGEVADLLSKALFLRKPSDSTAEVVSAAIREMEKRTPGPQTSQRQGFIMARTALMKAAGKCAEPPPIWFCLLPLPGDWPAGCPKTFPRPAAGPLLRVQRIVNLACPEGNNSICKADEAAADAAAAASEEPMRPGSVALPEQQELNVDRASSVTEHAVLEQDQTVPVREAAAPVRTRKTARSASPAVAKVRKPNCKKPALKTDKMKINRICFTAGSQQAYLQADFLNSPRRLLVAVSKTQCKNFQAVARQLHKRALRRFSSVSFDSLKKDLLQHRSQLLAK